ncbi:MAG: DUF72 domain-containing protein [Actinomycetota bacterium]
MPVLIGCSGWQYKDWRESFYPKGVAQKRWLEYYAERFQTVEVNNSFYMLPKPETFGGWAERTPSDFILTVKMSRYLTHIKRLKESDEPVDRFMSHAQSLGKKIGPILLQLPPNLKADNENLLRTLELLGQRRVRVTVEFRHESWWTDETEAVLRKTGAALTWADRLGKPVTKLWRTADWGYLRLHEGAGKPHPCYGQQALGTWARRIADSYAPEQDVYVYFNNDPNCCAVRDALVFAEACRGVGLEVTRVPQPDEVHPWGDPVPDWPSWFRR